MIDAGQTYHRKDTVVRLATASRGFKRRYPPTTTASVGLSLVCSGDWRKLVDRALDEGEKEKIGTGIQVGQERGLMNGGVRRRNMAVMVTAASLMQVNGE